MNIDQTLRETLRSHAAGAPDGTGLGAAVEVRSDQRHHRRQVAGAGIAVAVVVAGILAAPTLVRGLDHGSEPAADPGAAQELAATGAPARAGAAALVSPTFELPAFPFTPGWAPPGAKEPFAYTAGEKRFLAHESDSGGYRIHVEAGPDDPASWLEEWGADYTEQDVTVRGLAGVLRWIGGDESPQLTWRERSDLWVTVEGGTADELLRYAESMTEDPFPVRPPFTLELVPPEAVLQSVQPDAMWFDQRHEGACAAMEGLSHEEAMEQSRRNAEAGTPCQTGQFVVRLFRGGPGAEVPVNFLPHDGQVFSGDEPAPPRETIRVGDRDAEVIGDHNLHVFLDDGLALGVTALGTLTLSQEDLVRFAEGVQVTPDALPIFE